MSDDAGPSSGRDLHSVSYDLALPCPRRRGRYVPVISIGLQLGQGSVRLFEALMDSGAELCLFHGGIARDLGIDPAAGALWTLPISGVGGATGATAYGHRVTLYVGDAVSFRSFDADVGFTDPTVTFPVNVLGWTGFLDRVRVGIDGAALPPLVYLGFTL